MRTYGYTPDDVTALPSGAVAPGVQLTVWDAPTAGAQVLDLLDADGAPLPGYVLSGADGAYGWKHDGTFDYLYASADDGVTRWAVQAHEALTGKLDLATANSTYAPRGGTKLAWLGDSITRQQDAQPGVDGVTIISRGDAIPNYAALLTRQRVRDWLNAGVFGDTTTGALARLASTVTDFKPDGCVVLLGANDAANGVTVGTYSANMTAIVNGLRAANVRPFLLTPLPQNGVPAANALLTQYRDWIITYAADNTIDCLDLHTRALDPTTGGLRTELESDGVHPGPRGLRDLGEFVGQWLHPLVPDYSPALVVTADDPINLVPNGLLSGTANADGYVTPFTSWSDTPDATKALIPNPLGPGQLQQTTRTGGTGGAAAAFYYTVPATAFSDGDILRLSFVVQCQGIGAQVNAYFDGPAATQSVALIVTRDLPASVHEVDVKVSAGTTGIYLIFRANEGAGSVAYGQITARNLTRNGNVASSARAHQ